MSNPVVHFEVIGKDGARLQQYYSQLFGWKINADNPMQYGLVDNEGQGIGGGVGGGERPGVTFYVQVDDPQKYLDEAVRLGGKVVQEVTGVPDMVVMCQFADPEGNVIGIVKAQ